LCSSTIVNINAAFFGARGDQSLSQSCVLARGRAESLPRLDVTRQPVPAFHVEARTSKGWASLVTPPGQCAIQVAMKILKVPTFDSLMYNNTMQPELSPCRCYTPCLGFYRCGKLRSDYENVARSSNLSLPVAQKLSRRLTLDINQHRESSKGEKLCLPAAAASAGSISSTTSKVFVCSGGRTLAVEPM
jgi:hypothetical protein